MFNKSLISLFISCAVVGSSIGAELIDGENFIDPTRPLFYVERSDVGVVDEIFRTVVPSSYDISFIRAGSSDTSVAVINGVRVGVGDIIGGAEVVLIDREGVVLMIDDEERRINMYANSIKSAR